MAITAQDLVSYLRDEEATTDNVALLVGLTNGLIDDELDEFTGEWPTWLRIRALEIAEAGWIKFAEEGVDDWSGKRASALVAMSLTDRDRRRLATLAGRTPTSSVRSVRLVTPGETP